MSDPQLSPSHSLRGKQLDLAKTVDSSDGVALSAFVRYNLFVIALESPREETEEWKKTKKAAKRVSLVEFIDCHQSNSFESALGIERLTLSRLQNHL